MRRMIQILIASDYRLTLSGLRHLLTQMADFAVVAETDLLPDVAEMQQKYRPDATLLVPGTEDRSYPARLAKAAPGAHIVLISSNENLGYVRFMLNAGVLGYVLRKASDTELFVALRNASEGRRFIDPRLSDSVADELLGKARGERCLREGHLSSRELQVLRAIARGFTAREIATQLNLSSKTIETYRCRVYEKLNLSTRADLFSYAQASGLLAEEEMLS